MVAWIRGLLRLREKDREWLRDRLGVVRAGPESSKIFWLGRDTGKDYMLISWERVDTDTAAGFENPAETARSRE